MIICPDCESENSDSDNIYSNCSANLELIKSPPKVISEIKKALIAQKK